jgi:hypothetical protein
MSPIFDVSLTLDMSSTLNMVIHCMGVVNLKDYPAFVAFRNKIFNLYYVR